MFNSNKYLWIISVFLFLALIFSNLYHFRYKSILKQEISSLHDLSDQRKESGLEKQGSKEQSLEKSFYSLLRTEDKERKDPEVCGYKYSDVHGKLILNSYLENQVNTNSTFNGGVWANDCESFVYGIGLNQPMLGDPLNGSLWGVWLYKPETEENIKLISAHSDDPYPIVYRFITSTLVSCSDGIIDIDKKQIVSEFSKSGNFGENIKGRFGWVKYRDPLFPWTFWYPGDWKISRFTYKDKSGDSRKKLILKLKTAEINFYPTEINLDVSKYNDNYANFGRKYGFKHFLDPKNALEPARIYINEDDDTSFPKVITISSEKQADNTYVNNYFLDIFSTFEKFK